MKAERNKVVSDTARFWVNGDVPPAVAHYIRTVLVRTIERGSFDDIWPLLSLMYDLDEEEPTIFKETIECAKVNPESSVRHFTDWARRQAKPTAMGAFSVVKPDAQRVAEWLARRVKRPEYKAIYARDLETLLVLAHAADIAETTAAWRAQSSNRLPLPVLLFGESGTGKELLAKAMHEIYVQALTQMSKKTASDRMTTKGSFGPINCAGLPAHLIESELFGHEKNSFTGANSRREGIIAQHSCGTLFLDEIGDTPSEVQLRLIRFLNDGEVRPVGADTATYHYPWVIAATHRDLAQQVSEGKFREDLFNRLNGHVLTLKPLRQRGSDLFGALEACLNKHSKSELTITMSEPAMQALRGYDWKANLRAVDQFARRLVQERASAGRHLSIDIGDLSPEIQNRYFFSTPYITQLAHQYKEEIRLLSVKEREQVRNSLLQHFGGVLAQGLVPEMRFVHTVAQFAMSDIMRKFIDDEKLHSKIVRAAVALEARMRRQHEERLERDLFAVEGLEPPPRKALVVVMSDLPDWARRALLIIEELSMNPEAWESIRKIEAVLERFTPSIRAALSDLLAMVVEEAKKGESHTHNEVDSIQRPLWRDVRDDKALFSTWLEKAGSAKRMGDWFEKDEKTIRERAKEHGIPLPKARKNTR